ncbi:c-type heme family protein [Desulfarculus baarsii]
MIDKPFMKAKSALLTAFAVLFISVAAAFVWLVYDQSQETALREAEEKARIILERNLAIHSYFAHQLKPKIFSITDKHLPSSYFEPTWMSSTFAVRRIDEHYQGLAKDEYYYKECAINARSPKNEADDYEREFINELNKNPKLTTRTAIRIIDDKPFFVYLRRGESMEKSCLRCHSQPEYAPPEMVRIYGAERSFNRHDGELVSAISIRVPLSEILSRGAEFAGRLSVLTLGILGLMVAVVLFVTRQIFLRPLGRIREHTAFIGKTPQNLGDQIPPMPFAEWNDLAQDFNQMSLSLKESHAKLEERVRQRTAELERSNQQLVAEMTERERAEAQREELIAELRQALSEINQLSGLLPICASCKKIRDDKGYWQQIENYISTHSEAEFTHGICPECIKKLYPELD